MLANGTREGFHRSGETFPTKGKWKSVVVLGEERSLLFVRMRNDMMCQAFREPHTLGCCVSQETQLLRTS